MTANDRYSDEKVLLEESGDGYTAYCSPDANCDVLVSGDVIAEGVLDRGDVPFSFDINFERHPFKGEVTHLEAELQEQFDEQFNERVDSVFEKIDGADDPIEVIKELEPNDIDADRNA
jgi:hypothetical protein